MPDLWTKLHPNSAPPPSVPSEYPKWVGGTLAYSRADELRIIGGEAPETPVNALFSRAAEPEVTEKSRLQLEAQSLGIEVDRRWGEKKLRKLIEAHR